jgi:hypothetical protein
MLLSSWRRGGEEETDRTGYDNLGLAERARKAFIDQKVGSDNVNS